MYAIEKASIIRQRIESRCGVSVSEADANVLRRIEMTLHRWAELECGNGDDYKSWCVSRDEQTGKPFMEYHFHDGRYARYSTSDREAGALKRLGKLCTRLGLHFYHQTDPRGCALYVSNEPLTDQDYNRGVAVCA